MQTTTQVQVLIISLHIINHVMKHFLHLKFVNLNLLDSQQMRTRHLCDEFILGGKCLGMQPLSSPWDVLLYTTPDMDMSVRPLLPPPPAPPGLASDKDKDGNEETKGKVHSFGHVRIV